MKPNELIFELSKLNRPKLQKDELTERLISKCVENSYKEFEKSNKKYEILRNKFLS